jgi:siroheme synthase-like protein
VAFSYPIVLDLDGVDVLVVGGGGVALRKVAALLGAHAQVTVVAPRIDGALRALAVRVIERGYEPGDLDGARLVITATDDATVNAAVAADAERRGIFVNSADDPANCTFILPAVARDGAVTVAISTGGASPALASHLRDEIGRWLADIDAAGAATRLAEQRATLHAAGISTETIDWSERVREALRERT